MVKAAMDSLAVSNVRSLPPRPCEDPGHTQLGGRARLGRHSGRILHVVCRIKSNFPREETSPAPALLIFRAHFYELFSCDTSRPLLSRDFLGLSSSDQSEPSSFTVPRLSCWVGVPAETPSLAGTIPVRVTSSTFLLLRSFLLMGLCVSGDHSSN